MVSIFLQNAFIKEFVFFFHVSLCDHVLACSDVVIEEEPFYKVP